MSRIFMISDLHFGHKTILKYSGEYREGNTVEEHDEWLIKMWNSVVTKRDITYVLGDVAFTPEGLEKVARLNGQKWLILGNHDRYPIEEYMKYFFIKGGIKKYKGYWLSHAPIHPDELRGCSNIHGHVHGNPIKDSRYLNVCVEALNGIPIHFDRLKEDWYEQRTGI